MQKSISSHEHQILISLLKEIRVGSGIKQAELAKKLHQPQSFVSKYEAGERQLDILELRQICNILGVSLIDFLKRFEKKLK